MRLPGSSAAAPAVYVGGQSGGVTGSKTNPVQQIVKFEAGGTTLSGAAALRGFFHAATATKYPRRFDGRRHVPLFFAACHSCAPT